MCECVTNYYEKKIFNRLVSCDDEGRPLTEHTTIRDVEYYHEIGFLQSSSKLMDRFINLRNNMKQLHVPSLFNKSRAV